MKRVLRILIFCLMAAAVSAQAQTTKPHHKKGATNSPTDGTSGDAASAASADQAKTVAGYQANFIPTDPWRVLNEKTNYVKGAEWVQFEGHVTTVSASGLVLQGWFGEPLCYLLPNNGGATTTTFFLSRYPRRVAVGQLLSRNDRLVAYKSGSKDDLPNLDYGTVYVPELTDEQKAALAAAKAKKESSVLAWHKELAEKGDAYGEYKMGVRYLNGDGVDKDPAKGRDLLAKASAQGYKDATDELAKLPTGN